MVTMTSESEKRQQSITINTTTSSSNSNATTILPKKMRSPQIGDAPNILVYKKVRELTIYAHQLNANDYMLRLSFPSTDGGHRGEDARRERWRRREDG